MKLLPLTNDFVFKAVFSKHEDVLMNLLNSFPEFQKEKRIISLKVLNPEIPKDRNTEKVIVLDIKAVDATGNKFLIEMQASRQKFFSQRILYYWAKLYSKSISKGQKYSELPRIYSFNFVNFEIFPKEEKFLWYFQISDKTKPEILLTDNLNIYIIELPKYIKTFQSSQSPLDDWVYLLKEATKLKGEQMKTLKKKNPKIKKALDELKFVSHDKKSREYYEAWLKTERDYAARTEYQLEKSKEEAIEQRNIEIALTMLSKNLKADFISEVTGLSIHQIKNLQKKNSSKK